MKKEFQFKNQFKNWFCSIVGVMFLIVTAVFFPEKAFALDLGSVEIHGYGHQGFLLTDLDNENKYLNADDKGTWRYNAMAILFTAKPQDKTTVWMQLHGRTDIEVDWAYVDYEFSNSLTGRIGKAKLPWGVYNEVREVKFLQLSTIMPSMYHDAVKIVHESYYGASLNYSLDLGSGGEIVFDPIVGEIADYKEGQDNSGVTLGGRIRYNPPIEGLAVMATVSDSQDDMSMEMLIASLDYVNYGFDIKSEYAAMMMEMETMGMTMSTDMFSYYVQAGYTFFSRLTPFVRYDYITTDKDNENSPLYYQKSTTVGVGYKINHSMVVKAEVHINDGYALPVASKEVSTGMTNDNWNMYAASINFMF